MDIELPEVRSFAQSARFFNRGGTEYVEISFIGAKDTVIHKTKPEHMAKFRSAWDSYCDGRPMALRPGTALTELPEISKEMAEGLIRGNIHNLEEMAALTDHHCQALGHGFLTLRKKALQFVADKQAAERERSRDLVGKMSATIQRSDETSAELQDLKSTLAEQSAQIEKLTAALVTLATPRPRGRPKKEKQRNVTDNAS